MRKLFDVLRTFDDGDKLTLINASNRGEGLMTGAVSSCPGKYGKCKVERVKTYKDDYGLPVHKVYLVVNERNDVDPYGLQDIDIEDEDCSANQNW